MSRVLFIILLILLLVILPGAGAVPSGRITVQSVPSGALACVDTIRCDDTPFTFPADGNARHNVTVTAKGYRPWTEDVFVTADQTSLVTAYLDLDPPATGVEVSVTPGGSTVCIDNGDCRLLDSDGIGSTRFTGISEGFHTISVRAPAPYRDTTRLVKVVLGEITETDIILEPLTSVPQPENPATGSIRVYVDRTGGTICLDNQDCYVNVGGPPGPSTGTVVFADVPADVMHIVTVGADGFKPFSARVTVGKDLVATVDVALEPVPGAVQTATPSTPLPDSSPAATTPAIPPTSPLQPITTRSGLGTGPALGALALTGLFFLAFRKRY